MATGGRGHTHIHTDREQNLDSSHPLREVFVWGVVLVVCVCVLSLGVLFPVGVCVCDLLIFLPLAVAAVPRHGR